MLLAAPAQARPVVVEMFTSQACSDCPPADALLGKLAAQPGILALSFDVTYWNSAAWNDPYALPGAATRQDWYAGLRHSTEVYTPEAVVDGTNQFVGSDRDEDDRRDCRRPGGTGGRYADYDWRWAESADWCWTRRCRGGNLAVRL